MAAKFSRWGRRFGGVIKLADEARTSSTTLTNDATLFFSCLTNKKYFFRFRIWYDTPIAADFKYDLTGPTGTTVQIAEQSIAPGATSYGGIQIRTAFAFGPTVILETAAVTNGFIALDGIVSPATTDDLIIFRWAQNTSNGSATTVRAGSYVEYGDFT